MMPTSALALAGVIAIRLGEGADVSARGHSGPETKRPLLELCERQPSRYRHRAYPAHLVALMVTAAVHIVIAAVVIYDWQRPEKATVPDQTIVVTLLPLTPDQSANRPKRGVIEKNETPKPALAERPPPILHLPEQPALVTAEPAIEPPAPNDGGKADQLAQATQAYQRAITAQIEAVRSYPKAALLDGYQGTGAILFRIDREGRLLAVSVDTSTGRKALDRAALELIRRAAPFPTIPAPLPDELAITMPIRFLIVEPNLAMAAR